MKDENNAKGSRPAELRGVAAKVLWELPGPTGPWQSWRGPMDPVAAIKFSGLQRKRFWSDTDLVRPRENRGIKVPFELP
jgi:hypothetical protein